MNLSDLYAIGCLMVWSGSLGGAVAMFYRGKISNLSKTESFPVLSLITALIVGILFRMVLLWGNPDYLCDVLLCLTLFLALAGVSTGRFKIQKYGTIFVTVGTVGLYLFFTTVLLDPEHGYTSGDARWKARLIYFQSTLKAAAQNDKKVYPAGKMDVGHPLLIAQPDLARAMNQLIRVKLWHTCFTTLYQTVPLPPFDFPGGTIADNRELFYKQAVEKADLHKSSMAASEAKP